MNAVQGYRLEFINGCPPRSQELGGPLSFSGTERGAITEEVDSLLKKGAISLCDRSPGDFISQIFARPKKHSKKLRVILNLRQLNTFITYEHFKMESINTIENLMSQDDFMVSIDLTDAYFSIPIYEEDRKFLKFRWDGKLYQFNVLCFGLTSAPRVFTKCTKPIVSHLRKRGFRISIYIDDLILMHESRQVLLEQVQCVIMMLGKLGFNVNAEKSNIVPSKAIEHLGFLINSRSLTTGLPEDKVNNLLNLSWGLLTASKHLTIRQVARVIGCYNAYTLGTKWGKLYIRNLEHDKIQALVRNKGDFEASMSLSPQAKDDIRWWLSSEVRIPRPMFFDKPCLTLFSDASSKGWGAHTTSNSTGGRWSPEEASNHINWLELKACFLGLQSFANNISHACVLVHVDSTVALSYILHQGGVIKKLNSLAAEMWTWCKSRDIWLRGSHIQGVKNHWADERSRVFQENTEWSLNWDKFNAICEQFGTPEIDLFASRLNKKLDTYCSWEPDPDSIHVDAFTLDWGKFENCYAFPPFNLVGQVISKMARDNVRVLLLVCPKWPGQYWFPLLQKYMCHPYAEIAFNNSKNLLRLPFDEHRTHDLWRKLNLCCFRLSTRR